MGDLWQFTCAIRSQPLKEAAKEGECRLFLDEATAKGQRTDERTAHADGSGQKSLHGAEGPGIYNCVEEQETEAEDESNDPRLNQEPPG
jgi:hypothetical protein